MYEESKTTSKPEGERPTNRIGFLGLVGEKVDTIDHCNEKINEMLPKLEAEQEISLREKQKAAALVFFNSKPAAISAAQTIHSQKIDTWTVMEAPEPRQVLWTNLPRFLSKEEGIPSESHAVRAASGKYFYFVVFNVFLGVTIGGALFDSLKTIINQPKQVITLLGSSLPKSATFFLTFVALKFFVGYGLELSRLVPLIIFHLKKRFLCKTEAEVKEAWAPGDFGYATRVPNDMLIITIVLCYSVIAPIIIPFGVVYFGLGWLVARNQVSDCSIYS
ncbi:hypothetical protein BHE74_00034344 [Ensete ventricosum]|nr:hypothetical protein BHE74_00034344 [Ensete ventricosum]